jgi:hypothetical protein
MALSLHHRDTLTAVPVLWKNVVFANENPSLQETLQSESKNLCPIMITYTEPELGTLISEVAI